MDYAIIVFLVSLSGLFSGLTIGLTGLDKFELERKIKLGIKDARRVYSVRKHGNLLLCTLLLGNVAVNSALSIYLGSIASGLLAGFIATALIVVFGEIIPAATCSRYAMTIGAKTAWFVKLFIYVLFPVCWPLSKILDTFLGEEMPTIFTRMELREIVQEHENSLESNIDEDEEKILLGALSFSDKTVAEVLTPRTVIFALDNDTILDAETINVIKESGFTRIPVYEDQIDKIIGILYAKDLIGIEPGMKIEELYRKDNLIIVRETKTLDDILNDFKRKRTHLAFVFDKYGGLEGLITLEDIIENILNDEIIDETDPVDDLKAKAEENAKAMFESSTGDFSNTTDKNGL